MMLRLLEWRTRFYCDLFNQEEKWPPDKSHQLSSSPGPTPLGWGSGHSWYALLQGEEGMG